MNPQLPSRPFNYIDLPERVDAKDQTLYSNKAGFQGLIAPPTNLYKMPKVPFTEPQYVFKPLAARPIRDTHLVNNPLDMNLTNSGRNTADFKGLDPFNIFAPVVKTIL